MAVGVNNWNGALQNSNYYGSQATGVPQYYTLQNQNGIQAGFHPIYVHGLEGANAYQLPPGVLREVLWDDVDNRFYIKGLDEYGRPKILADNDFGPHVDPPKDTENGGESIDFSIYPTKKDLEEFLSKFNASDYLTKNDLDKALSELSLGTQGRIVRNEHNA